MGNWFLFSSSPSSPSSSSSLSLKHQTPLIKKNCQNVAVN
ncbi:hypothetical protein FDUTEX481_07360 [Tolypothrix sp. PCC 7601]|nr:hypothetical protein FDUTEX481_07360 [Tolypothrix sp. PCC 7601]